MAPTDDIILQGVDFAYPGCKPLITSCSLSLPRGSRCLLIGANGAGKTTLLQIVAGKYMVPEDSIRVLGFSPFFDLNLTCSGQLSYLGSTWRKDVACTGSNVPLQGDVSAGKLIFGVQDVDPQRRAQLIDLLDIDLTWRMHRVSDGQRRRVQICMGLLKPYKVLLMDEITVDLDVLGRLQLLQFFTEECEQRGCTILYATHILDGLEGWITHVAYMEGGLLKKFGPRDAVVQLQPPGGKLLQVVEQWLGEELRHRRALKQQSSSEAVQEPAPKPAAPYFPSKHMAFYR